MCSPADGAADSQPYTGYGHLDYEISYTEAGDVQIPAQPLAASRLCRNRRSDGGKSLVLTPYPFSRQDGVDAFGNPTSLVDFLGLQDELVFSSRMQVVVIARPLKIDGDSMTCVEVATTFAYLPQPIDRERLDASRFLYPSPHVPRDPRFGDWAAAEVLPDRPVREGAEALMRHIHTDFAYLPGATDLATPTREVLEKREGVCQDFAHVMMPDYARVASRRATSAAISVPATAIP